MQLSSSHLNNAIKQNKPLLWLSCLCGGAVAALLLLLLFSDHQKTVVMIIGGGVALAIGTLILLRPHWGGYALAASIMFNASDLLTESGYPGITSGLVGLTLLGIGFRWLRTYRTSPPLMFTATELWMIGYLAVNFASVYVAKSEYAAYQSSTELLKDCAVLFAIVFAINSAEKWKTICWIVLITAVVPAALGILSLGLGIPLPPGIDLLASGIDQQVDGVWRFRFGGPIRRPNFYAQLLITALPLALYQWVANKHWLGKHVIGLGAIIIIGASAFSYSRAAFITLIFVLGVFALQQRIKPMHLLAGLVTSTLVLFVVAPSGYTERLQTLLPFVPSPDGEVASDPLSDLSFIGRFSEAYSGLLMFIDSPLLGVGRNNYPIRYQDYAEIIGLEYRDSEREAHSLYVELMAETGIAGIIAFGGVIFTLFQALIQLRKQPNANLAWLNAITLSITAYLANSVFLHAAYLRFFLLFMALALIPTHIMLAQQAQQAEVAA